MTFAEVEEFIRKNVVTADFKYARMSLLYYKTDLWLFGEHIVVTYTVPFADVGDNDFYYNSMSAKLLVKYISLISVPPTKTS